MKGKQKLLIIYILMICSIFFSNAFANCDDCECDNCCEKMGGIKYCDSSGGRYVCNNGSYSTCYCTRHAIMNLQKLEGCCLWQGGVLKRTKEGLVICRNGSFSELCSIKYTN